MVNVYLTQQAILDFENIALYSTEQWGKKVTEQYLKKFENALSLLAQQPNILKKKKEVSLGLWFYRVEKHFLVCDFIDDDIYVLAVKHGMMDLPKRLAELEPSLKKEVETLRKNLKK